MAKFIVTLVVETSGNKPSKRTIKDLVAGAVNELQGSMFNVSTDNEGIVDVVRVRTVDLD